MKSASASPFSAADSALRAAGARVTPSRLRVLHLLQSAAVPLSHGEIEDALSGDGLPGADRVTIYRVLDWLCEAELAQRATDARGVFRFSAAQPNAEHVAHAHFRCTGCGGVFCLKSPPPATPDLPRGFRLGGVTLDIHGECPRCVRSHS